MKTIIILFTILFSVNGQRECDICQSVVTSVKNWYATNGPTDDVVFHNELLNECSQLSVGSDLTICKTFVDCQHNKIHGDVHEKSATSERTCIDIGSCPGPLSSGSLNIVDWTAETTDYNVRCVPVVFLVLHHTVTASALETLHVLQDRGLSVQYIAEKNGTIYQMVHDYYRAWHAGTSHWGTYSDLNSWAIGVEIVNIGDEPFPAAQLNGVIELSRMLIKRWHIEPANVVGHFDIQPQSKMDPSGYFDWKTFYTQLGLFPGVFVSKLTPEQQKAVILSASSYTSAALKTLQQQLASWGYSGSITVTGTYDQQTKDVIQAFNRHWCPEVFILEYVENDIMITDPRNTQWYGISQERLDALRNSL